MSAHLHGEYVDGCYRCELRRDEACEHLNAEIKDWSGWLKCMDCGANLPRNIWDGKEQSE